MNPQAAGAEPPEDHWASLMAASSEASEKQMLLSLAQQLALREQHLLGRVKLVELQRLAFAKSNKAELAPNVMVMVTHFNKMSRWTVSYTHLTLPTILLV